ncbi:30S ribosome-binding factor RbfA [Mycoplasma procyoni]|uniref:30S ribosome-binding factor RbfA n=1 Tax=Mycoplasma procyoni TaxID=568784 RepID=UPI00197B3608|nr:30S ribosome-binding factor RbfA [Mycoplasma procyoni]MBN3535034.1 30S ribosome-binding factor RbfA [Mycoplasma procyoni]
MNLINLRKKESLYLLLISKIISEDINNANVIDPTVSEVQLSKDGSHLKVFVSFLKSSQKGLEGLENAKGFIRRELARRTNSRTVPELHFFIDDLAEKASNIDKILAEIKAKQKEKE